MSMKPDKVDNGRRIAFEAEGIIGQAGFVEKADFAELAYLATDRTSGPSVGDEVNADGRKWKVVRVERIKRPLMFNLRLELLA